MNLYGSRMEEKKTLFFLFTLPLRLCYTVCWWYFYCCLWCCQQPAHTNTFTHNSHTCTQHWVHNVSSFASLQIALTIAMVMVCVSTWVTFQCSRWQSLQFSSIVAIRIDLHAHKGTVKQTNTFTLLVTLFSFDAGDQIHTHTRARTLCCINLFLCYFLFLSQDAN